SFAQSFDSTAWKYAKTIKAKEIKYHINILASDEFEGRETGKEGQQLARNYIRNEFIKYRIPDYRGNEYIQWFSLVEQENNGVEVKVNGNAFYLQEDFIMKPSVVNNQNKKLELVFVGYGVEEESLNSYESIDVKGKAVLLWNEKPKEVKLEKEWTV